MSFFFVVMYVISRVPYRGNGSCHSVISLFHKVVFGLRMSTISAACPLAGLGTDIFSTKRKGATRLRYTCAPAQQPESS